DGHRPQEPVPVGATARPHRLRPRRVPRRHRAAPDPAVAPPGRGLPLRRRPRRAAREHAVGRGVPPGGVDGRAGRPAVDRAQPGRAAHPAVAQPGRPAAGRVGSVQHHRPGRLPHAPGRPPHPDDGGLPALRLGVHRARCGPGRGRSRARPRRSAGQAV
ncbi:MAG: hypothetical protein AVDCRST_MAG07-1043, partial [uncultured Frankineae bacterium]